MGIKWTGESMTLYREKPFSFKSVEYRRYFAGCGLGFLAVIEWRRDSWQLNMSLDSECDGELFGEPHNLKSLDIDGAKEEANALILTKAKELGFDEMIQEIEGEESPASEPKSETVRMTEIRELLSGFAKVSCDLLSLLDCHAESSDVADRALAFMTEVKRQYPEHPITLELERLLWPKTPELYNGKTLDELITEMHLMVFRSGEALCDAFHGLSMRTIDDLSKRRNKRRWIFGSKKGNSDPCSQKSEG